MANIVESDFWKEEIYSIVRSWRIDALVIQEKSVDEFDATEVWKIEFSQSEPWEFAHMINAALWAKVVDSHGTISHLVQGDELDAEVNRFAFNAAQKISRYTCDEKKWFFDLHLKTLQLGYERVRRKAPAEWQALTWGNFPSL